MDNYPTARPSVRRFRSSYNSAAPATSCPRPFGQVNYRVKSVSFSVVREANAPDPQLLTRPKAVATLVRQATLIPDDGREHFVMFFLNTDLRVIGYHVLAVGTLDRVLLSPREVYGAALRVLGTASIILVHNHPSGNPRPSRADIALTKRIAAAGRLLDVPLKDHVIVGNGTGAWTSLADKGVLR